MKEYYINVYKDRLGGAESSESAVYETIAEAQKDAQAYSGIYAYTAVCTDKLNLSGETVE